MNNQIPILQESNILKNLINSNPNEIPQRILKGAGWEMLHNETIYSCVYGSLYFYMGLPFYFDGKSVIFNGFRISPPEVTISEILKLFSNEFQNDFETLNYWGVEEPIGEINPNLKCTTKIKPDDENRDVILDLNKLTLNQLHSYRFVRKAISRGLSYKVNQNKEITPRHLEIVNIFNQTHPDVDEDGGKYINGWVGVLKKTDSVLFEIFSEQNVMTGFLVLSLFFDKMPTYAYGFFDNQEKGTSDLAYAAMIEFCIKSNFQRLDLGYTVKNSLLRYKLKWGPLIFNDAPWYITWEKK